MYIINRRCLNFLQHSLRLSGTVLAHVRDQASSGELRLAEKHEDYAAIVPISDVNKPAINAINYSKTITENVVAVHVCVDPVEKERMRTQWEMHVKDVPLIILDSINGSINEPLIDFIDRTHNNCNNTVVVAIPELVLQKWWHHFLHNRTGSLIKEALRFKEGVIITSVPYKLRDP